MSHLNHSSKMHKNVLKYILFFAISIVLILIDQYTKYLAKISLQNKPPYVVIKDVVELVYTENEGAAFGILQGKQWLFYVLTVIIIIAILIALYKLDFNSHNIIYFIFLTLLFSGAIGNFIDRVKNRYVVDFIYFKPINFPVFNFADMLITIACVLIIIATLTIYRKD